MLSIKQTHAVFLNDPIVTPTVVAKLIYGGWLEMGRKIMTLSFGLQFSLKKISVPKEVAVGGCHSSTTIPFASVRIFEV